MSSKLEEMYSQATFSVVIGGDCDDEETISVAKMDDSNTAIEVYWDEQVGVCVRMTGLIPTTYLKKILLEAVQQNDVRITLPLSNYLSDSVDTGVKERFYGTCTFDEKSMRAVLSAIE
ncbi:MAG: hypothetical protein WC477_04850 [Patescibacteria group bacterium]